MLGILEFLHIVEVDMADLRLHSEASFGSFMQGVENQFPQMNGVPLRWYSYKGSLPVKEIRQWDGEQYS